MPAAPNEETIYDFEGQLETAVERYLEANGFATRTPEDTDVQDDYMTGVRLRVGDATGQFMATPSGDHVYSQYNADLEVTIRAPRRTGSDVSLYARRAALRREMSPHRFWRATGGINDYLSYHQFQLMRPEGTDYDELGETQDETTLRFVCQFAINPDAWPE